MDFVSTFKSLSNFFSEAKKREEAEYEPFFKFYEEIVKFAPQETVVAFNKIDVKVQSPKDGKVTFRLELTAFDYHWWQQHFNQGLRFIEGPVQVRLDILSRMSALTKDLKLTQEERDKLFDLLKG